MSALVFLGDTVWPGKDCIDIDPILPSLCGKRVVVNLEGPILQRPVADYRVNNRYKTSLHSDPQILEVMHRLGVVACSLANNHINDYHASVDPTIRQLSNAGIGHFGTERQAFIEVASGGARYVLLGACAKLPEPKSYAGDSNPHLFRPQDMLRQIASLKSSNPDARIVCVVHWGYELTLYPEPADREWAHRAIEAGADFVIGHHPHVVQGVERVGSGFVAYSLGNFLMPHGWVNGSWLGFLAPEVLVELGVEITTGGVSLQWITYDKSAKRLVPLGPENGFDEEAMLNKLSPFAGMSDADYRKWFSSHGVRGHLTKRRGGPIYRSYFGAGSVLTSTNDRYMVAKRQLRKGLMWAGLHQPRVS
jgi:Bacterial capsule synthesis protein PGA_cap